MSLNRLSIPVRGEPEIRLLRDVSFRSFCLREVGARGAATPRAGGEARRRVLFFGFETEDSGRWESGKPAFGFPLFHRPRRRHCGNVGISPALGEISKGLVERVGSLLFGFPLFPQSRHFHSAVASSCGSAASQPAQPCFL